MTSTRRRTSDTADLACFVSRLTCIPRNLLILSCYVDESWTTRLPYSSIGTDGSACHLGRVQTRRDASNLSSSSSPANLVATSSALTDAEKFSRPQQFRHKGAPTLLRCTVRTRKPCPSCRRKKIEWVVVHLSPNFPCAV